MVYLKRKNLCFSYQEYGGFDVKLIAEHKSILTHRHKLSRYLLFFTLSNGLILTKMTVRMDKPEYGQFIKGHISYQVLF